ncbi:MAG TPA: hypothetical protein VFR81_22875 [Longimicrobium sp.]|nr:hypothetical protein [Longimicrobium sp.]
MTLLLGTNAYPAAGDGLRRQTAALEALRGLRGVRLANVQWPDEVYAVEGFRTLAALREDSLTVTGRSGRRKPIVTEIFDALCGAAEAEGAEWFGYTNSDASPTQTLVDRVLAEPRDGWIVSRMDVDGETGAELGVVTPGLDTFVVRAAWWRANRRRFRRYIAGEPVWDNVFAAILRAHGDSLILNRGAWVRHERHPAAWTASPFADYVRLLAALDRPHFSLWARYHHELEAMRARGASEDEEMAMQARVFRHRPTPADRALQAGRAIKARLRYLAARRGAR